MKGIYCTKKHKITTSSMGAKKKKKENKSLSWPGISGCLAQNVHDLINKKWIMHDLKQSWLNFAQQKKVKIAKGFVFLDQYVTKAQHPYIDVNCRILVKTEKVSYRLLRFRAETLERKGTSVVQICSKLHQHLLKETVESSRNLLKKKRIKKSRHDQSSSKPV